MSEPLLLIPGPTMMTDAVRTALSRPAISHRSAEFRDILGECFSLLSFVFATKNPVLVYVCSGSGAQTAAVENVVGVGESFLSLENGAFSQRFSDIGRARGADVTVLRSEPGEVTDPEVLSKTLREKHFSAVALSHCETSTSAVFDLHETLSVIREAAPDTLVIVDAISSLGAMPCAMDELGVDILISASQKVFAIPAGLGFVGVSPRAFAKADTTKNRSHYFDFLLHHDALLMKNTPFSASVNLIFALHESLKNIQKIGLSNLQAAHHENGIFAREMMMELGFELLVKNPKNFSASVTAVHSDRSTEICQILKREKNIVISDGQGELYGKVFRIGHLGNIRTSHLARLKTAFQDLQARGLL